MKVPIFLVSILAISTACLSKSLDIEKLDYPFGRSVTEVAELFNIEHDDFARVTDSLYSKYRADFATVGTAPAQVSFFFYAGKLNFVRVHFDSKDSSNILHQLRRSFGPPQPSQGDYFIDEYYWFPKGDLAVVYSVFGNRYEITTTEQMIAHYDTVMSQRMLYAADHGRFDLRKVLWGMTKEDVRASEHNQVDSAFATGNFECIVIMDSLFGMRVSIAYAFVFDRLASIDITFHTGHTHIGAYIARYESIRAQYIAKYGKPSYCTPGDVESGSVDVTDFAFLSYIECYWIFNPKMSDYFAYNPATKAWLILSYDNEVITFGAKYACSGLENLVKMARLQDEMNKF